MRKFAWLAGTLLIASPLGCGQDATSAANAPSADAGGDEQTGLDASDGDTTVTDGTWPEAQVPDAPVTDASGEASPDAPGEASLDAQGEDGPPWDFVDDAPVEDTPLAAGWTCSAFIDQQDVWMRTYEGGQERFDLRIGAGGSIAELRDATASYAALLSPSFAGESTDRVVQWTWWSQHIQNEIPSLPAFEWRFNVTQAGTFDDVLAPTHWVELDAGRCRVDVYAAPRDQWKAEQRPFMQGELVTRTRYQIVGPGAIVVRRTIRVGDPSLHGQPTQFLNEYIEAWTPFRRPTFDALAVSLDGDGNPTWWYRAGYNLPAYPHIDVTTTPGYAVVFDSTKPGSGAIVGVVFGTSQPCRYVQGSCIPVGDYVLNMMEWNTGIGVLPGLRLEDLEAGQVIDQAIVLLPGHGLTTAVQAKLASMAALVPAPRLFDVGAHLAPPLSDTVQVLDSLVGQGGTRTGHLAPLVK